MKNWRSFFFNDQCEKTGCDNCPGCIKTWVAVVLMTGLFLACGYLEGLDHAIYAPR